MRIGHRFVDTIAAGRRVERPNTPPQGRGGGHRRSTTIAPVQSAATTSLRTLVEEEARRAKDAAAALTDEGVAETLTGAAARVRDQRAAILEVNAADCARAEGSLDAGMLDRLRLDDRRVESMARQLEATAEIAPLEREVSAWTLSNGLRVSERRVPIGAVGANFEARPNVVLDAAAQLLKSLNAAVLRTGSAALATATYLVDDVLRPALSEAELPPEAVALVRSPEREGARVLVSLPRIVPLVILRGSGETTAALARLAAEHGVATLAHAEGGGVLYVHAAAARERALAVAEASLDRLGVCNRLNLALVDRGAVDLLSELLDLFARTGVEVRAAPRALELADGALPLDRPLGYEWANDPERVGTVTVEVVDGLEEAVRLAHDETSGLAAGIVTENAEAAERFLAAYRGSAAFWHASTRFADGFELTGVPETGINVGWAPGPRGPVTYRDLWLRQYRVVGDATQTR
jgi:glutamate-5-semialdehyde dehydrogenase